MPAPRAPAPGIDLYWIPLGAGGSGFVRLNGRIYEATEARREGRQPLAIYHTALEVRTRHRRYVVETMWPSPDADTASRGVVLEGPVFLGLLGRWRTFRYEVRRWPNGVLPDAAEAIGGPQRLSDETDDVERLLDMASAIPPLIWGRDQLDVGEMWNSNSVIAWLLATTGLSTAAIRPPDGGRAPGWDAGVAVAERSVFTTRAPVSSGSVRRANGARVVPAKSVVRTGRSAKPPNA